MVKYTKEIFTDYLKTLHLKTVTKYNYHTKKSVKYYNVASGFDIETSSTYVQGDKFAFMYIWMFGIKDTVFYGRTWGEFIELNEVLKKELKLSETKKLICYIQNLEYEFQFMRKYFEWSDVFAINDRKPIKCETNFNVEYRCSYILSGFSLQKIGEHLQKHTIKKMVGDLDYTLTRHRETELTNEELKYCENDVLIILYYITEQIEIYDDNITKIPLTNTGKVRKFCKDKCLHSSKTHRKDSRGKRTRFLNLMQELQLTTDSYIQLKRAFMGGFTHASLKHVNQHLHNVYSIDFTSSYPSAMLSEKFPMSRPIEKNPNEFNKYINNSDYCCLFDLELTQVESQFIYETYISESKCYDLENPCINNGRVFSADKLKITITDVDFKIIQSVYNWENMKVTNLKVFYKSYLPKSLLMAIIELYQKKTTLKGVEGKEVEYLLSKGMLNSVYGMSVTDIIRDEHIYNDTTEKWEQTKMTETEIDEKIQKTNESKTRFLYYAWGVWVTRYARYNLWTGISNIGDDYIYSDTDSIKFLNYEKHKDYIDEYNKDIKNKLKTMCKYTMIDYNLLEPTTQRGIKKPLGVWDYEGKYSDFKTLGAKRYIYVENNKLHITIRGLNKKRGAEYLEKTYKTVNKIFNNFNDELYVPRCETGKLTHTYIDTEKGYMITDYKGKQLYVKSLSGIHLEPCEFTLSISRQYANLIQQFRNGYIIRGTIFTM